MKIKLYASFAFLFLSSDMRSQNFVDIVQVTEKAVFLIETFDKYDNPIATGSGFFINEHGMALSNVHVFENAHSAKIKTYDNKYFNIENIVAADADRDVILFSVLNDKGKFHYLSTDTMLPLKGQDVFVVGSPEGLESSVSKGIVASTRKLEIYGNTIQFTAAISHGNSGSPLLNMRGRVIGIVTFALKSGQDLNFAISSNVFNNLYKDIKYRINSPINEVKLFHKAQEYYATAVRARNDGRIEEAMNYFKKYIDNGGDNVIGYMQIGFTKELLKDYSGALSDYDRALLINPTHYATVVFKISLLRKLKEYSAGVNFLDKVLKLKPMSEIYYDRGLCKEGLEDYRGAVEDYSLAINLNSQFVEALTDRGKVKLFYLVLEEEANQDLTRAISINPNYAKAYVYRGYLRQFSDPNGACEDFRKSLSLEYSESIARKVNSTCH